MEDKTHREFLLPSKTTDDLLQIVKDFMAGKILFSSQVDPDMLGSVFMPLGLGGLCYPVDEPIQKVSVPLPPLPPVKPTLVKPVESSSKLNTAVTQATQALDELQFKHRWETVTDDVELAKLAEAELAVRTANIAKQTFHESAQQRADSENDTNEKAYQAALISYDDAVTKHTADFAVWEAAETTLIAEWTAHSQAWGKAVEDLLGVIYGYFTDTGPRGVNGYPIFFTMHMLNKADWDKVKTTIKREQERTIELG